MLAILFHNYDFQTNLLAVYGSNSGSNWSRETYRTFKSIERSWTALKELCTLLHQSIQSAPNSTQAKSRAFRVHRIVPRQIQNIQSAPNSTKANTRAFRVHQISHRQTPEHSECTKQYTGKHQSIQSAPNNTHGNTRTSRVYQIRHRQTPEHSECTK